MCPNKVMIPKDLIGHNRPCSPGENPSTTRSRTPACAAAPAPVRGRRAPAAASTVAAPCTRARPVIDRFSPARVSTTPGADSRRSGPTRVRRTGDVRRDRTGLRSRLGGPGTAATTRRSSVPSRTERSVLPLEPGGLAASRERMRRGTGAWTCPHGRSVGLSRRAPDPVTMPGAMADRRRSSAEGRRGDRSASGQGGPVPCPTARLGRVARLARSWALAALTLGAALGRSGRLTYHEAIVAQAAREMLARGRLAGPDDRRPALAGEAAAGPLAGGGWPGGSPGGWTRRRPALPSAVAAAVLALGVATLAARRFGPAVGRLAGAVQATTAWTVMRGPAGRGRHPPGLPGLPGRGGASTGCADEADGRRPGAGRSSRCSGGRPWPRGSASAACWSGRRRPLVLAWDRDREALRGPGLGPGMAPGGGRSPWPGRSRSWPGTRRRWGSGPCTSPTAWPPGPSTSRGSRGGVRPVAARAGPALDAPGPGRGLAVAGAGPVRDRGGIDRLLWAWAVGAGGPGVAGDRQERRIT